MFTIQSNSSLQNDLSKPDLKRKQLAVKAKIIQGYDETVLKEGKLNKTQFALKHGLAKSNLQTILTSKSRQFINTVETDGKVIEGRKKSEDQPI